MKILNLYSGIGGNRHLWGDEHEITAIEINPDISAIYKSKFPNLSWGTCIVSKKDNEIIVQRFISKEICRKYCTAPTCYDFGIGLSSND